MNYPWSGRIGRIAKKCIVCGTNDYKFRLSSRPMTCHDCIGKKFTREFLNEWVEEYEKLAREWCSNNGYDYDIEITKDLE